MHVIDIDLRRLTHDIYLFLAAHYIDTKPSAKKLEYLAVKYIESWKKNPNIGLIQWLEINTFWNYDEEEIKYADI